MPTDEYSHEQGEALRFTFSFSEDDVVLDPTPQGVRVSVDGCRSSSEPGGPALPIRTVRVAVPPGMWPGEPQVREGERQSLTDEPVVVLAAQLSRPGVSEREDDCCCAGQGCCTRHDEGDPNEDRGYVTDPFPHPAHIPPDPVLYEAAARDRKAVLVRGLHHVGPTPLVTLELRPVRYAEDGTLELVTRIEVEVPYGPRPTEHRPPGKLHEVFGELGLDRKALNLQPLPELTFTSRAQADRHAKLVANLVVNKEVVGDLSAHVRPILDALPADYLVITDNVRWNADTITPAGPLSGDLVAEFERLTAHKRSRGLTTKVVTVTDIVGGRYGDFRTGARDLQEVIRRFLKDVHQRWGVAWLLLGGDIGVIPMRAVAGGREGTMDVATDDPPKDNASHWTGSFLKMHVVSPGTWWPGDWMAELVNESTGTLIPFDPTGATATSGTGWYFTTNDTYSTRSATSTNFVRVNGSASVANGTLRWLYQWNQIPTDFYYASLQGWVLAEQEVGFGPFSFQVPYVFFPDHDWDVSGNGIYAQFPGDKNIDGVAWATDLSVGRAPVSSGSEAKAFVDKVLSYENYELGMLSLRSNADDWVRRVLIASSDWGGPVGISKTHNDPPGDDSFHTGATSTVIHLKDVPASGRELVAHISDNDRRVLAYSAAQTPPAAGWYYTVSATDHSANGIELTLWGSTVFIALPSKWIVVNGAAAERNPDHYELDDPAEDGSMSDQEQLRQQMAADLPGWSRVTRLYADLADLTPAERVATPVSYLTSTRIEAGFNASPHIVSMSGHGNPDGVDGASAGMAAGLTNADPGFIAYADSCLTSAHDWGGSLGEELVKSAHGAVAYLGNTRFSWIGQGDDVQRWFFHGLTNTRHLGLLNDTRLALMNGGFYPGDARWTVMAMTLYGDPEMQVWRRPPNRVWPKVTWPGKNIRVPIEVAVPKPPFRIPIPDPPPYVIHVSQPNGFEQTMMAEAGSVTKVDISGAKSGPLSIKVAIRGDMEHVPFEHTISILRPGWLTGQVTAVLSNDAGHPWTEVTVKHLVDDVTTWTTVVVAADDPERNGILDAVVASQVSEKLISLYVDWASPGALVKRFRLGASEHAD